MEKPVAGTASRRLVLFAVLIGCAVLAGSLTGAKWSVEPPNGSATPAPPAAEPRVAKRVCQGHVDIDSGVVSLYPVQSGRVTKVLVHENDEVAAGTPLFELDNTQAKAELAEAKAALAEAEAALDLAQELPAQYEARVDAQKAAIQAKERELEGAKARSDQAQRMFEKKLANEGDKTVAVSAVSALEAIIKAEKAKLRGLEADNPEAAIAKAEQNVEARKAKVALAEHALNECTVRAPIKGTVLRLELSEGEVLGPTPRHPVLQFCPDSPRIIRAEVEQEFADGLAKNQEAEIHDDSNNDLKWKGKVIRIGGWYTRRRSIIQEPMMLNDVRTLECILAVEPNGSPLRIGQRVRVTFLGAKVAAAN